MEQSTSPAAQPQSNNAEPAFPAEYWSSIDGLYPELDTQQPEQQQPLPPSQQELEQREPPQGITWDHPILSQSNQPHERQASFPQQHEHIRDFYSGTPQSWGQNPSTSGEHYGLSHQHPYQMQHAYPQDQVSYNSRPLSPSNLTTYPSYPLSGQYYQNAGLQSTNAYTQPRHQNIAPRPPSTQQQPILPAGASTTPGHQYILPATNMNENLESPAFNQYAAPTLNYQNTINPRFLSSLQEAAAEQPRSGQNQFLFYNPSASSYDRPNDPKAYQIYPDNLGPLNAEQLNARQQSGPGLMSHLRELAPYPIASNMLMPNGVLKPQAVSSKKTSPTKAKKPSAKKAGLRKPDGRAVSDSDTDSSDSDLEVEEPEEPSPLPAVRPSDPEAAMQYDTIKAVWAPRNRYPNVDRIKSALVAFKDVVKAVRDQWKTQSQALKEAENQNNNEKAAELRQKVVQQRQLINVVISTTLDKGHPIIVEKLGEHPMAVAALYSFLLDRHQASDYEGTLFVNILTLLSRFTTLDDEVLSKTNISKLLPRILKKGSQPSKDLAQKILDNAALSTKRKQESASGNALGRDATPDKAGELVSGTKRNRDGELNGLPVTKKMATPGAAAKNGPHSKTAASSGTAKRSESVTDSKATSTAGTTRPKASIVPPKPTSLFGSLMSASKKPGTSNAARAAAAAAAAAAKEKASAPAEKKASPPPAQPAKPAFSFGDILAGLNQREEASAQKSSDNQPPETEEDRKKRLRKEARRKLRVSWKPDEALVEVRLFTHDPDEVVGLGDDLKRDVGDLQGEGRMLKLHKDLDVEDDEEMEPQEEEISPWTSPPTAEYDTKDQESNFVKRGGSREPDSPERVAQQNREATTLMVFYTSPADVPTSPKEPPAPTDDEPPTTEQSFGEPDDKVKARAARYFAMMNPQPAQAPTPTAPAVPNGSLDIANLLKVIQNGPQQASSTPPPPQQPVQLQQNPLASLEQTINLFRQQQRQQIMPQVPQIPQIPQLPQAQPQPQVPAPSNQPVDFQKILAVLNAQKQMNQPAPLPIPMTQSQPAVMPNLAAIVSQLSGNRTATPVSQPPTQSSGPYEDPERKRLRDMGRGYDNGYVQGNSKRPRMYVDPEAKKHPRAGSVPCRFWREGKCLKGEDCTFRHDPADLV